jgi:hypothetical protein
VELKFSQGRQICQILETGGSKAAKEDRKDQYWMKDWHFKQGDQGKFL